jgi:hypothetical protein
MASSVRGESAVPGLALVGVCVGGVFSKPLDLALSPSPREVPTG